MNLKEKCVETLKGFQKKYLREGIYKWINY